MNTYLKRHFTAASKYDPSGYSGFIHSVSFFSSNHWKILSRQYEYSLGKICAGIISQTAFSLKQEVCFWKS